LLCTRDCACFSPTNSSTTASRLRTCMRPLPVCLRLGLLLQGVKVHCEQLNTFAVGLLLPHRPHSCHTLSRVEQHCSILGLLLLLAGQTHSSRGQQEHMVNVTM
jgi:hypothetical protein